MKKSVSRIYSAFLAILLLNSPTSARASDCGCSAEEQSFERWNARMNSAVALIADGQRVLNETSAVVDRARLRRAASLLALNATEESLNQYQSLFQQYQQALQQYQQHRRDFAAHSQAYHNMSQPEMISGGASFSTSVPSKDGMQALKYRTENKCAELQQLESTIIANEEQLQGLMSQLYAAQQKEGAATIASLWSQADSIAVANNKLASQFNHLGLLKTAQLSKNVSNLIAEANRDGAYNAHMQAYFDLSNSNQMENELHKRANYHSRLALGTLSQLSQLRPASIGTAPPPPDGKVYTADELDKESNALDAEYANVQTLFQKLEAVRKTLPPGFNNATGNN